MSPALCCLCCCPLLPGSGVVRCGGILLSSRIEECAIELDHGVWHPCHQAHMWCDILLSSRIEECAIELGHVVWHPCHLAHMWCDILVIKRKELDHDLSLSFKSLLNPPCMKTAGLMAIKLPNHLES